MKDLLHNRLIQIAYKHKQSHLSSSITSLPIIYDIYEQKNDNDVFILSNGHAGLALYVVLENFFGLDAEMLLEKHGVHPCFDLANGIYCSTGSLGLGLPIGIGYALSNPKRKVYVLISDGETFEGSIWESLSFIDLHHITNIEVHVNVNGYSAYDCVDREKLSSKLLSFLPSIKIHYTDLKDYPLLDNKKIEAHYCLIKNKDEERELMK
jgi:transketolase